MEKKKIVNPVADLAERGEISAFWNCSADGSLMQVVKLSLQDNGNTLKGQVFYSSEKSWYFLAYTQKDSNGDYIIPTYENQYKGFNDNGTATNKYNLFWSSGYQCWVWTDNTLDNTNTGKFRYIEESDSELVVTHCSTNLDGLVK